jgi:hypothetical protein
MADSGVARVALLKRELSKLIELAAAENERYNKIAYSSLDDDEAGDLGDDHELINRMLANLSAIYQEVFDE